MVKGFSSKKIALEECLSGMRLAEDIFSRSNHLIMPSGTVLDDPAIAKLASLSISSLTIAVASDKQTDAAVAAFEGSYVAHVETVKNVFASIEAGNPLKLEDLRPAVVDIVNSKLGSRDILHSLDRLRNVDEYTYDHSLNVGILSMMLARWLGRLEPVVEEVCYTGILHDIGKALIPGHILNKPGALNPVELKVIKEHSTYGYNILQDNPTVSERIRQGVLDHHERIDGTGYPLGTSGLAIHDYGRIVAVADVYDAMVSDRCYRKKDNPFDVLNSFKMEFLGHLDSKYIGTFIDRLSGYFVGERVNLSDGREAEVVFINSQTVGRPVVKVEGEMLDLGQNPDITISSLV